MIKKSFIALTLILPTLVLLGFVTNRLAELNNAPTIRLPITGYDPVHILHGRYIQFQFDPKHIKNMPNYFDLSGGLCLKPQENALTQATFYMKKDKRCIDIWTDNIKFFRKAHKFFIDERYALPMEKLIRKNRRILGARRYMERERKKPTQASKKKFPYYLEQVELAAKQPVSTDIELAISPSGAIQIKMLYIDGIPWTEYVEKNAH